ncbi:hypothetical protein Y888_14615 [Mixta calida B021323]|nr:hypothetical protein Y888_14615 [Mixta calida B021323]
MVINNRWISQVILNKNYINKFTSSDQPLAQFCIKVKTARRPFLSRYYRKFIKLKREAGRNFTVSDGIKNINDTLLTVILCDRFFIKFTGLSLLQKFLVRVFSNMAIAFDSHILG